ncbi:MAG: hypothetical protein CVU05_05785 [Bacteroidetes bacterium HGW-Bacteroidetes-21]|jgi:hypothetical protein|nr:MAG: hypothetical protein CVU05_05785 [Bacteroidetes bacterium HGW-Bacteroidetes-21]
MKNIVTVLLIASVLVSCSKDDKFYTRKLSGSWEVETVTRYQLVNNSFTEVSSFNPEGYFLLWDNHTIYKGNKLNYSFAGQIPYCVMEVMNSVNPDSIGNFEWYSDSPDRLEFNIFTGNAKTYFAIFQIDKQGKNTMELSYYCRVDSAGNYQLRSSSWGLDPNCKEVLLMKRKRK